MQCSLHIFKARNSYLHCYVDGSWWVRERLDICVCLIYITVRRHLWCDNDAHDHHACERKKTGVEYIFSGITSFTSSDITSFTFSSITSFKDHFGNIAMWALLAQEGFPVNVHNEIFCDPWPKKTQVQPRFVNDIHKHEHTHIVWKSAPVIIFLQPHIHFLLG